LGRRRGGRSIVHGWQQPRHAGPESVPVRRERFVCVSARCCTLGHQSKMEASEGRGSSSRRLEGRKQVGRLLPGESPTLHTRRGTTTQAPQPQAHPHHQPRPPLTGRLAGASRQDVGV
jgi:hypothetical protein